MPQLVLKRPHTHAGMAYPAGERIDVEATTADWLIAQGVATPPPLPEAVRAKTPVTTDPDPKPLHRKESKS